MNYLQQQFDDQQFTNEYQLVNTVNRQNIVFQDFTDDQIHGCHFADLVCQYAQRMKTPCNGSLSK